MYAPTKSRSRLREAISKTYTPLSGCRTNPETEVLVTTGANEGIVLAHEALEMFCFLSIVTNLT